MRSSTIPAAHGRAVRPRKAQARLPTATAYPHKMDAALGQHVVARLALQRATGLRLYRRPMCERLHVECEGARTCDTNCDRGACRGRGANWLW